MSELPEDLQGPPEHLSPESKAFFDNVTAAASFDAPARMLLVRCCEIRDELSELRKKKLPVTFNDKHGQPRLHPEKKYELALTNELGKLYRYLGWDQAPSKGPNQMDLF